MKNADFDFSIETQTGARWERGAPGGRGCNQPEQIVEHCDGDYYAYLYTDQCDSDRHVIYDDAQDIETVCRGLGLELDDDNSWREL